MFRKFLPKSNYARNVITLMTGTGIAQAIPIAISPILTRLYSPQEFGTFALYMAVVSIVSVLVTGRYELAILLPKLDRDAINIVALAVGLSFASSVVLFVLVALFGGPMASLLGAPGFAQWLYWVPASTLLLGVYQTLNYWTNRRGQYRRLAISRTVQSGTASVAQLGGGSINASALGLIGGQMLGQVLSTAVLAFQISREDHALARKLRLARAMALAKKYKNFPRFLIVAHGFNAGSRNMPVVLLNAIFGAMTAGLFTLVQRVMGAPMVLIAGALGDVFRQEASHAYVNTGNCRVVYQKTFQRLLAIALLPFVFFFFSAPLIFAFVFGEQWRGAGIYAQLLTPMFFLQFVTSPLSSMYMIAEKQKLDLLWQSVLFFLVACSFFVGYVFGSAKVSIAAFSASYCLMYSINGIVSHQLALGRWRNK